MPNSSHRATGALVVRTFSLRQGDRFKPHEHATHQLTWASKGVLTVTIEGSSAADTWVLPSSRALWIPGGHRHAIDTTFGAAMRCLYFSPERCPVRWPTPTVLSVSALLHQLIEYLARDGLSDDARLRAEAVVFDLFEPVAVTSVRLPMPTDPRAGHIADALIADPSDCRSLQAWARAVHTSERTLTRLFTQETGLTFRQWRMTLRIRESLPHLASGMSVAAVAHRVGYETPSAFVAAFCREIGVTPASFFGRTGPTAWRDDRA
ncbi:AraC family transcriptional regulator [Nonomuraea sp. CA-143628]|uniref:AraC family transcriptional regulator n=1 Tax=Nonomuraea sp. CA-143628 TaxID=3239997 RepID=UPI003D90F466